MTEMEFRAKHSEVIEYYQYIEMRLKGICAAMLTDEKRSWFERLDDYQADPLGKLLKIIQTIQAQNHLSIFSHEDFEALDSLREARNYWVHQCFSADTHVIFKNGTLKNPAYAIKIINDLRYAIDWDEKTASIFRAIRRRGEPKPSGVVFLGPK